MKIGNTFWIGFGLILLLSYSQNGGVTTIGFPFTAYQFGGICGVAGVETQTCPSQIFPLYLLIDLVSLFGIPFVLNYFFNKGWMKG